MGRLDPQTPSKIQSLPLLQQLNFNRQMRPRLKYMPLLCGIVSCVLNGLYELGRMPKLQLSITSHQLNIIGPTAAVFALVGIIFGILILKQHRRTAGYGLVVSCISFLYGIFMLPL
jgi:hypothetical protein